MISGEPTRETTQMRTRLKNLGVPFQLFALLMVKSAYLLIPVLTSSESRELSHCPSSSSTHVVACFTHLSLFTSIHTDSRPEVVYTYLVHHCSDAVHVPAPPHYAHDRSFCHSLTEKEQLSRLHTKW